MRACLAPRRDEKNTIQRLLSLNWGVILVTILIGSVGVAMLYSVAGGAWDPWASRHSMRLGVAFIIMLIVGVMDIRYWMALSYPAWGIGVLLLVAVEFVGDFGKKLPALA